MARRRLRKALERQNDPETPHKLPMGCMAEPIGDDLFHWRALIIGPQETCYEDGHFHLKANFPEDYPFNPPEIVFVTKIYHPRVHPILRYIVLPNDELRHGWSPALTFAKLLGAIRNILINPDPPKGSFNMEMTKQFMSNRKLFDDTAAQWVKEHAPPPKHPVIEHLKYEYSISEQHVLCTFSVSFARCELQKSETYHLRIQYNDNKIEVELQREHNAYSVAMPITMEYGGMLSIESSLCLESELIPFTTQHHELYLNALTDREYVVLISGFWRECCPEIDINADLVAICHRFYYHPFEITMRWKIHEYSTTFIEERTMRLTDAKDINIHCKGLNRSRKWMKEKFFRVFGMGQIVEDNMAWKLDGTIFWTGNAVKRFIKASYPKTVIVWMDFSKFVCFDAKYQKQVRRIVFLRSGATLSSVKRKVRSALQLVDVANDLIQLVANGNCIHTDLEMRINLFPDNEIVVCLVRIDI